MTGLQYKCLICFPKTDAQKIVQGNLEFVQEGKTTIVYEIKAPLCLPHYKKYEKVYIESFTLTKNVLFLETMLNGR